MPKPTLVLVKDAPMGRAGYRLTEPWESAIAGWIAWLKIGGASPNTLRLRREHVRPIARRVNVHHPRMLTLSLLVEMFSKKHWSNEYRRGVRTSLISFCEWCVTNGMMDDNPAFRLPTVPGDKPKPRPATDEIWRDLLDAAPPRERMMARLAGEAGLRRAEVAQTKRDDLVRDAGGWALIILGKGDRQRVVPITDGLASAIIAFCQHGYLFPGQVGGHISAHWVGVCVSKLMPPGWSMHKLRHRYATRGYAGTRNLRAVQEALGHSSVATTERYTLVTKDEVRSVSEAAFDPNDAA